LSKKFGLLFRRGSSLVTLGSRVFYIGGEEAEAVEEFDYVTNTWSSVEANLAVPRLNHGTVAVPAKLFAGRTGDKCYKQLFV
jgi:hypothetical protein